MPTISAKGVPQRYFECDGRPEIGFRGTFCLLRTNRSWQSDLARITDNGAGTGCVTGLRIIGDCLCRGHFRHLPNCPGQQPQAALQE
jgi:hypothetical protein